MNQDCEIIYSIDIIKITGEVFTTIRLDNMINNFTCSQIKELFNNHNLSAITDKYYNICINNETQPIYTNFDSKFSYDNIIQIIANESILTITFINYSKEEISKLKENYHIIKHYPEKQNDKLLMLFLVNQFGSALQ
jgi:hypothetical protein